MKKIAAIGVASLMTLGACGAGGSGSSADGGSEVTTLSEATNREVSTLDYVVTALVSDHEINANLVDGLLENDNYGKLTGALAESWESNDDATVWTFHLRPDVKWVTNTGEEYGVVTADDFVTGVRHGAEFESGTAWLLQGVVKGYNEYLASDFSDAAWENVGVKALDEQTVEFTMEQSVPYFDTMTTYTVLYPVNRAFLESKGEGCKLGAPDKENCGFGSLELDSILYNGGYILSQNDAKSSAVLTKNQSYWDAEHVYLETVTRVYDGGEDPYSIIRGFEDGTYARAALNPSWEDYQTYVDKYESQTVYSIPNASVFGVVFNYNRKVFEYTNYASDQTLAQQTHDAIMNENFRKALRAAFDTKAYLAVRMPDDLAEQTMRNINNFPGAGSTSDGKTYYDLVTDAYTADTGEDVDLGDAQMPFYDPDKAKEFIEAAKGEGVTFPVHLDVMVNSTSDVLTKQAQSMKQSIEANTDGQIIIELVMETEDTINSVVYENQDPEAMDYDISTYTGWSPDYGDPKSFVDIYSPTTGYYMQATGLGAGDANQDLKTQLGFMEYEKLYRDADAITDDMDARYEAFAKADAYLVEHALYIPTSQQARGNNVTKYVPFSRPYSDYGVSEYKYKGLKIQNDIVTTEEFQKAFDDFTENR
ncbi:MAG: peptide ABC transporter substrate-binding protein [Actinomycetaceae bacterium]|nr:peptide ABC transporter substrate-binding protein [Arcanobacterium sp.]MDD7504808.1 peptide ABC transporter substrate-binding protein [Actinomycetaceae bacterium]